MDQLGNHFPSCQPGRGRRLGAWTARLLALLLVTVLAAPALAATITVTYPNGGQTLYKGNTYTINWTSTDVTGTIAIDLYKGATNVQRLTGNAPNTGSYSFTPAFTLVHGADYRIGLSAMSGTVYDFSNAYFTIASPTLTVTSPNGGEVWELGSTHTITWTSSNVVGNVLIQPYINGVAQSPLTTGTANDGSFSWGPITGTASTRYTVGISAMSGNVSDFSNAVFTVQPLALTVSAPNGGESWPIGSTQRIQWSNPGGYTSFNLEISRNGGSTWSTVENGLASNYTYRDWVVTGPVSSSCRMRVTGLFDNGTRNDVSNANFSIVQPIITVGYPNGGETLYEGHSCTITWNSQYVTGDIAVDLYKGATNVLRLTGTAPNTGSYTFTVPTNLVNASDYRVALSAMSGSVWDYSNSYFTLSSPSLTVISPNGGEVWELGSTHTITWTSSNVLGNVLIQPYINGVAQSPLSTGTANDGSFSWGPITGTASTRYTLGLSAMSGNVSDFSNAVFTVQPQALTISAPNGGESWQVGSTQRTQWSNPGGYTSFNLELSRDGGSTWTLVEGGLNADYTYRDWVVTEPASSTCRMRVTGLFDNGSRNDVSNSSFSIAGASLTLLWPDGGQTLHKGHEYFITWSSLGVSGGIAIDIIKNGVNQLRIVGNAPNTGSFAFTPPFSLADGSDYQVGLSAQSGQVWDYSAGDFTLDEPTLTLTSPSAGQQVDPGEPLPITWTSQFVLGGILLQPYLDGVPQTVITTNATNDGSYLWTLPASFDESTCLQIGISAMGGEVYDMSDCVIVGDPPLPDYPAAAFFSQLDPAWSGQQLGTCPDTMGESGCAVTCVAMLLAWESGSPLDPTPAELNAWLAANGGYSGGCLINWERSGEYDGAATGLEYIDAASGQDQWSLIDSELDGSPFRPVVVEVDGTPGAANGVWLQHFVVVYHRSGPSGVPGSYQILDPLQTGFNPSAPRTLAHYARSYDGATFQGVRRWQGEFPSQAPQVSLSVAWPNGGETLHKGHEYTISWTSLNVSGGIAIDILKNGENQLRIAGNASNTGSFTFTPPFSLADGADYQVGISAQSGQVWDYSDGHFTLDEPSLTLLSPLGGEQWEAGTTHTIQWSSQFVLGTVLIQPYLGGMPVAPLTTGTANDGVFEWSIPADYPVGPGITLGLSAMAGEVYTFSGAFTITPPVWLAAPQLWIQEGVDEVLVSWSAVPNATAYRLEQATATSGPWTLLGELTGTQVTLNAIEGLHLLRVVALR